MEKILQHHLAFPNYNDLKDPRTSGRRLLQDLFHQPQPPQRIFADSLQKSQTTDMKVLPSMQWYPTNYRCSLFTHLWLERFRLRWKPKRGRPLQAFCFAGFTKSSQTSRTQGAGSSRFLPSTIRVLRTSASTNRPLSQRGQWETQRATLAFGNS